MVSAGGDRPLKLADEASKPRLPSSQPQLGERLRYVRHSRRRSLGEVADATGISASFLSLVETGRSDITISRLMKLVQYYGSSVIDLLGSTPTNPMIVRRDEQHHLASRGEGIEIRLLSPDTSRTMMPILVTYEAGGQQADETWSSGESFLHVISGTICLLIEGEEPVMLATGDSAYFTPNRARRYENRGKTTARMIVCVTPPHL